MKLPLLSFLIFLLCGLCPAWAIPVLTPLNMTGAVAAQTPGSWPDLPASQALDGKPDTCTGTWENTQNPWLTVTLASAAEVRRVVIYNRTDCCQDRLRDITISAWSGTDETLPPVFTSALLNAGGEFVDPVSLQVELPAGLSVRKIRIHRKPNLAPAPGILSVSEVQLYTAMDVALPWNTDLTSANIAGLTATQSSRWPGLSPMNALDNDLGSTTATAPADAQAWWELDFGEEVWVQKVTVYNRTDCCQGRFRDINVIFYDGNHVPQAIHFMGAPGVSGFEVSPLNPLPLSRYIRIARTADGSGTEDGNILSLAEVKVTGMAFAVPELTSTILPGDHLRLSWPSLTMERYSLETTSDLRAPWTSLGNPPGGEIILAMEDDRRFYRLTRLRPGLPAGQ